MLVSRVHLVYENSFSGNFQNKFSCREELRERGHDYIILEYSKNKGVALFN